MGAHKLFSRVSLTLLAGMAMGASAHARSVTLDKWMPTIRLCPVSCISVSGHKLRNGNKVNVLQVRNGWARISPWLDAERLKRSFGERVPEKPAYWVELARTSGLAGESAAKTEPKKTNSRQRSRVRRVTLPTARPAYRVATLYAAEDSLMVSALAADRREPSSIVDAVMAKVEQPRDGSPVAVSLPANPSERALSTDKLSTDKMAAWIKANRGNVVEDARKVAISAQPDPKNIKNGAELETQIAALKTPKDEVVAFGNVPDVMTSELLDKRLNVLPGMNSKVSEETVIALRHYALGLLNSKSCKGIAGGGAGEKAGTIYLVCTDDLTRMREFGVSQESSGALN